ncbi:WecB/TagA/CpsF family glycosyltransferase [Faecalicatena contorta]|uniref:WecB/TagA/CpsF family glycosyltransferase n=1 Tax=Faecalicatena contorta TaxID=39482 RepID=UPI001F3ED337|nr:WecB/TagA/CpsF family glycosyltransferase [Faecalicatena contorta]MCF2555496.1 WecB/TagA/CpsF family glycosyltransferase [Faecalicatena contorta]MCF2680881.1 WecB/TagA/CpsF family glycosyltransferase [Faecalicatena contorta]
MSEKLSVLDIEIDQLTAKEAIKNCVMYLDTEPVNIVEMVTVDGLMQMEMTTDLKESVRQFDMLIAGDTTILDAASVRERRYLQETEDQTFLKLVFKYFHKNHKRVYLLVESEEEGQDLYGYIERHYGGLQIVGLAKVSAENRADDMLVNAINGSEADCVISFLSVPLQEEFILKNRGVINTRIWLGIGKDILLYRKQNNMQGRFGRFITKYIFRKEIEKRKRIQQIYTPKQ